MIKLVWFRARILATLLGLAAASCWLVVPGSAGAAESLPPVSVVYEGSAHFEVLSGDGGSYDETTEWKAEGESGGQDGALSLRFSSINGSVIIEGPGTNCGGTHVETYERELNPAQNPYLGWSLDEAGPYPFPGWRYVIPVIPSELPMLTTIYCEGASGPNEQELAVHEVVEGVPFSPAKTKQLEEVLQAVELEPGHSETVKREFHTSESEYECSSECPTITANMQITAKITGGGEAGSEPKPEPKSEPPKTEPKPPPVPTSTTTEDLRRQRKEEAVKDIPPTYEKSDNLEASIKHAEAELSRLPGGGGVGSLEFLISLDIARMKSELNQELRRLREEYETAHDPADPNFSALAEPVTVKAPALRGCGRARGAATKRCVAERGAEMRMLSASSRLLGIYMALHTTIDRDTAAISAGEYPDAESQSTHFQALHDTLESTLAGERRSGAALAGLLRARGSRWSISRRDYAKAATSVAKRLTREGMPASALKAIGLSPSPPRKLNVLAALAAGAL